jgi:hypothetical protein
MQKDTWKTRIAVMKYLIACMLVVIICASTVGNLFGIMYWKQGSNFIAAIAVEGEQNAVDHCANDGNFLPYSAIFIL